jgi:glycosyltransferase involved in cell wall biosynthesis
MRENHPRVTIGVPVFNGEAFLAETLESLLSQTFSDLEVVISDNGSQDRTQEICQAFATRDPRVHYYRNEVNRGAAWNHNRVFELAQGEFFKWNSADDLCAPEFVARCVAALDQDPTAVMAISQPAEIDAYDTPLASVTVAGQTLLPVLPSDAPASVRFRQTIRLDHLCLGIYSLMRSNVLRETDRIGNYSDSDRVLLAHLALIGRCVVIPETLLFNRDHGGRFSRTYDGTCYSGWRTRAVWFDPSNANRWVFPLWKEFFELWGVVRRGPLKWQERLRAYEEIVRCFARKGHMRHLYFDATHYPRQWVVRQFPWAKVVWNALWAKRGVDRPGATVEQSNGPSSRG